MVDWYYSYLKRRHLEIELHGDTATFTSGTGFPQGGVCSAKFWLIAFNEAIKIINSNNITGTGYADDCCALIGGRQTHNMIEQMQTMLERLANWGHTCGLSFNPQKTVAVMFSRSKKQFTRGVRMEGQVIPISKTVVYLGVTLDYRLYWSEHVQLKAKKAKGLIMKLASISGTHWGPKPKLLKWAYTGIVRPVITYAAMTWAHEAETPIIQTALRRVNRAALNTIVSVPRSTPTRAMELILDIPPLHLVAKREGLAAYLRLQEQLPVTWEGVYRNLLHSTSHLKYWNLMAQNVGALTSIETDKCSVYAPAKQYHIVEASFTNMLEHQTQVNCNVYTDGSKQNGKVGAGVYILKDTTTIAECSFRLPNEATVFQAEVTAIKEAAYLLKNMIDFTEVKFFVDSQAALKALAADTLSSKLVHNTLVELNSIPAQDIKLVWTKAHIGTEGNEKADQLAKKGTELPNTTPTPLPTTALKELLDKNLRKTWNIEWQTYDEARQSKIFIASHDKTKANHLLQWPKRKLGRYIRATTGHNNLLYHLNNMDNSIPPACRFCLDHKEEFQHLAYHCPALWWDRHITEATEPEHADNWTPDQIISFCLIPKINDAFVKPLYHITEHTTPEELRTQQQGTEEQEWMDEGSQESAMDVDTITSTSDDSPPSSPTDNDE